MKWLFVLLALGIAIHAWAVPPMINYQGYLTQPDGTPLDTLVSITFRIYADDFGGPVIWDEIHDCVISGGYFETVLGIADPFSANFFDDHSLYLGVQVGTDTEMTPLVRFYSAPYAHRVASVNGAAGGVINGKLNIGTGNTNSGMYAMVAGENNHADGSYSVISGGGGMTVLEGNSAGSYSFIGGGSKNIAGDNCVVSGGFNNSASNVYATVGGGTDNTASGENGATVAGGSLNQAIGLGTTVGGGRFGNARGAYSVVAGGGGAYRADSNSAIGDGSNVSGGSGNAAFGIHSVISGGRYNRARGNYSTIGGGGGGAIADSNSAVGDYSTVGGGYHNWSTGVASTIAGGYGNRAVSDRSTVGGGQNNYARGDFSVVAGGGGTSSADSNSAIGNYSVVSGGTRNKASGLESTVGGGYGNTASGLASIVGGGDNNIANGTRATVPGGFWNRANGVASFAGGFYACANHNGSFVWGSTNSSDSTSSFADYSFTVRAPGGVRIYTSHIGTGTGVYLSSGGGAWNNLCDVRKKHLYGGVNTAEVLQKVTELPLYRWSYKTQDASIRHVGPTAQDFYAAFSLGENDTTISTLDPDGIALAAIQELAKQVNELREENRVLHTQIQTLLAKDQQGNLYKEK